MKRTVQDLVGNPTVDEIERIAHDAQEQKQRVFDQYGWRMNHVLTEGDVRVIIDAIKGVSNAQGHGQEEG